MFQASLANFGRYRFTPSLLSSQPTIQKYKNFLNFQFKKQGSILLDISVLPLVQSCSRKYYYGFAFFFLHFTCWFLWKLTNFAINQSMLKFSTIFIWTNLFYVQRIAIQQKQQLKDVQKLNVLFFQVCFWS